MKENIFPTDTARDNLTEAGIDQTRIWEGFHWSKNMTSIFPRQRPIQVFQNCCMRKWKCYYVWRVCKLQLVGLHSKSTYKVEDRKTVTHGTKDYYNKWQLNLLGCFQYFKLHIYTVLQYTHLFIQKEIMTAYCMPGSWYVLKMQWETRVVLVLPSCSLYSRAVILNWGLFCPPGDIWHYLTSLLAITTGLMAELLASDG